jgi:hypothetical protein
MIPHAQPQGDSGPYYLKLITLIDKITIQIKNFNDNQVNVLISTFKQAWISLSPSISTSNKFKQQIIQYISLCQPLTPHTLLQLINITHSTPN